MLSNFTNLFFPLCSLTVMVVILTIFFFKKNTNDKQTDIFSKLILIGFCESITTFLMFFITHFIDIETNRLLYEIINKFLFVTYIGWFFVLYHYESTISSIDEKNKMNRIFKVICALIEIAIVIAIIVLPMEIYFDKTTLFLYPYGLSLYALLIGIAVSILFMIIAILMNIKKMDSSKYIPIIILIVLLALLVILKKNDPLINLNSNVLSLITLIIYIFVENPDIKMVKKMEIMKNDAERASRSKSDFITSMSREIRTPLNTIIGFSEDLQQIIDHNNKEVLEDVNYILSASKTMQGIVGNILDINKIETKQMVVTNVKYNFSKVVDELISVATNKIGNKNIKIVSSIAPDIPFELIGDKEHIKTIINNLLSNAINYTDEGEVSLTAKCIKRDNICDLIIRVADTGRGIAVENMNKLFTKFEKLDDEPTDSTDGAGLGLAITKGLIELMGGNINVQSQLGKGSVFIVQIPQKISLMLDVSESSDSSEIVVTKSSEITDKELHDSEEVFKNYDNANKDGIDVSIFEGKKILIVDDNQLNIKVTMQALKDFGFIIDSCKSGYECLDKIKTGDEYDLLLLDIMMPNLSGESTLSKLKENSNFKIPTIALTADAIVGAKEKYLLEGFIDYIAKPFNKSQIVEKVYYALKKQ